MKLFRYEWGRMLSKPLVVFSVLILLLGNAVISQPVSESGLYSLSQKKALYQNLSHLTQPEKLAYLTDRLSALDAMRTDAIETGTEPEFEAQNCVFTGNVYSEAALFEQVMEEVEQAEHYEEFLDQIDQNAEKMTGLTFFSSGNPFDAKILAKTPAAYAPLRGTALKAEFSDALTAALTSPFTTIFLWILAVIFGVSLTSEDLEKETATMIRSTKYGRSRLTTARLFVVFSFSAAVSGLMIGVSLIVGGARWGLGDLTRVLQSVPYFHKSTLSVTVLEYLLLDWGLSCLTTFLAALLAMVFTGKLVRSVPVYVLTALVLGGEYALYLLIPSNSYLNPLKYLNLAALGNHFKFASNFYNLNFFGEPAELLSSILIAAGVLLFLLLVAVYRQGTVAKAASVTLPRLFRFQGRGLFLQESYKLLIMNKSVFALLAMGAILVWNTANYTPNYEIEDLQYKAYIQAMNGKTDDTALDYIAAEEAYFQTFRDAQAQAEEQYAKGEIDRDAYTRILQTSRNGLKNEGVFARFRQEVFSLRQEGIGTILYKTGFQRLIGPTAHNSNSLIHLFALAVLAVTLAPIYAADHGCGADALIQSTKNGRKRLMVSKLILACSLGIIVSLGAFLPGIVNTLRAFGTDQISENVRLLFKFPVNLSILNYILLLTGFRAILYCGAAMGFTAISNPSRTTLSSLILCVLAAGAVTLIGWVVL